MNPLMLKKKQEQLQQELEIVNNLLTAPLRYLAYVQEHGTAFGKTFKKTVKNKAAGTLCNGFGKQVAKR